MSKTPEEYFKKSAEFAEEKKYEKSEKILYKLLKKAEKGKIILSKKQQADLHYFRGKNFCRLKMFNEGANEFDTAFEISKQYQIEREALSGDLAELRKTYAEAGYPSSATYDWQELNRQIAASKSANEDNTKQ